MMEILTPEWMATSAVLAAGAFYVLRLIARVSNGRLMRCPSTGAITQVRVLQISSGDGSGPLLLVHGCLLWPEKGGCGQGCLERYHETCDGIPNSAHALRPFELCQRRRDEGAERRARAPIREMTDDRAARKAPRQAPVTNHPAPGRAASLIDHH